MEIITVDREKPKPSFSFKEARTPGREIIRAQQLVIGYREPLTLPMDLLLERGEKVAIKGVNGLGKSTLLTCTSALWHFHHRKAPASAR